MPLKDVTRKDFITIRLPLLIYSRIKSYAAWLSISHADILVGKDEILHSAMMPLEARSSFMQHLNEAGIYHKIDISQNMICEHFSKH